MARLVAGRGGEVIRWMDEKILSDDHFPEDTVYIANYNEDGTLRGAACFTDYRGSSIAMHFAGSKKGWLSLEHIRAAFRYVFEDLGCHRAVGLVRKDNLDALITDIRLGFTVEALLRQADDDGTDMYLVSMLKDECRWLKEKKHG